MEFCQVEQLATVARRMMAECPHRHLRIDQSLKSPTLAAHRADIARLQSFRHASIMMKDRVKDHLIDAPYLFLDLRAADPDRLGVGKKLLGQFRHGDDVGADCLRDVVRNPFVKKVDAACAHLAISWRAALGSANEGDSQIRGSDLESGPWKRSSTRRQCHQGAP